MIVQGKDDTFPAGQTFKQTVAAQTEMIVQREKKQTLIRANPADAVIVEGKSARTGTGRMQQRRQILFETHGFHERLTSCWKGRKTGQGPAGTHARNGGRERFSFEKGKTRGGGTGPSRKSPVPQRSYMKTLRSFTPSRSRRISSSAI